MCVCVCVCVSVCVYVCLCVCVSVSVCVNVQWMTDEGILVEQCFTLKAICRFGEDIIIRRGEKKLNNVSNDK